MTSEPILIAGGGIGGMAAALALGQKGYRVRLLEQASKFGEAGAGIQLGPNVFKMFKILGLTDAISELAVYPDALIMRDGPSGEEITRIPVNTPAVRAAFEFPYAVIYRPDLHRILVDACRAIPEIDLQLGTNVTNHRQTSGGVIVTTEDREEHHGAGLLGADGLWSRVRESIVGDGKPRVSGHIAYRAVLPINEVPEHLRGNAVTLWAGPKTHLVQYPLHRGEIMNIVAVFHSDRYEEGWNVFGETEELNQRFSGQHPDVLELLSRIESWRMWVLCDREPVKTWSDGRIGLIGDAAHPMLQYLAQGACMAIEDAVCLATRLERRSDDWPQALLDYQADRYLRTARVQLTARFYGDVYHAAGPTAELRDMMLKARTPEQGQAGVAWLYGGVDDSGGQVLG
ncbi:MAG: 3-hydroxybenzoate 6-monooxygenase [Alphaproteobacteria bacterium]|nr:3-hydroxybenzoate 6-monooxygenase [Alphaproteobacteria bacterium]